MLQTHTQNT